MFKCNCVLPSDLYYWTNEFPSRICRDDACMANHLQTRKGKRFQKCKAESEIIRQRKLMKKRRKGKKKNSNAAFASFANLTMKPMKKYLNPQRDKRDPPIDSHRDKNANANIWKKKKKFSDSAFGKIWSNRLVSVDDQFPVVNREIQSNRNECFVVNLNLCLRPNPTGVIIRALQFRYRYFFATFHILLVSFDTWLASSRNFIREQSSAKWTA